MAPLPPLKPGRVAPVPTRSNAYAQPNSCNRSSSMP